MARGRIAVDWDATCAEESWPELGDWIPGAIDALHRLLLADYEVVIHTCRVSPYELDEETPRDFSDQVLALRNKLDLAALLEVGIWTQPGKPQALWYIDNKTPGFVSLESSVRQILGRHPMSERFHQKLYELGELHDRKQEDYGSEEDPFANVRSTEEFGIPGWVGGLVRLNDKVVRLKNMVRKGRLVNESAEDSMRDIAVYSVISLCLYEEELERDSDPDAGPDPGA